MKKDITFFNFEKKALDEALDQEMDFVLIGIPYEKESRKSGTKSGPDALRRVSSDIFKGKTRFIAQTHPGSHRLIGCYDADYDVDILENISLVDAGDIGVDHDPRGTKTFNVIEKTINKFYQDNIKAVVVGGDHSISFPVVKALSSEPLNLIHIDAHEDLGQKGEHCRSNNVIRWIAELGHVRKIFQIGIRGFAHARTDHGSIWRKIISPAFLRSHGIDNLFHQLPVEEPYYVTIDTDALDPVIAPGISTPVPGGFNYHELKEILWRLGRERKVVGFDFVEFNPRYDHQNITAHMISFLILSFLGAISTNIHSSNEKK